MKYRNYFIGGITFIILIFSFLKPVNAQFVAETIVTGVVYGSDGNPLIDGNVTVNCGVATQSMPINPDGSYELIFQQAECKAGDIATAYANTSQGTGQNSGEVQNSDFSGSIVDIDIAIVDVNLSVPEFGAIPALFSLAGSVGVFQLFRKQKAW